MGLIRDSLYEFSSLGRSYPPFVMGRHDLQRGEVPLFVFHTIEPARFASQLEYLVDSGYRTIGLAEYEQIMRGAARGTGREVLLTIDDARSSLWRYGYPLLRRHGCTAVTFVITGWTRSEGRRPSLDDVARGTIDEAALAALDPKDRDACTWEELRIMQSSGHVEVESHTHLHQRLFCGERVESLVLSDSIRNASDAVFSPYLSTRDDPTTLPPDAYLGYPLTRTVPLMSCSAAFRINEEYAIRWRDAFVRRTTHGATPAAQAEAARQVMGELGRVLPDSALTRLGPAELRTLIRADLSASQATLRRELNLADVGRHLCLPFFIGSPETGEIARELGFRTILWGATPSRRSNHAGDDPLLTVRIKNDFIWRLPGSGRRSLPSLYLEKFTRRLTGIAPY